MNKKFLALALAGALTLTMLTACSAPGGETTPTPSPSTVPSETVPPTNTPSATPAPSESATPSETIKPSESATPSETTKPSESAKPSEKPATTPKPSESAKPSEKPAETVKPSESAKPETSVVQSIWDKVSSQERPSLMDLDASLLADFYGIAEGDLEEFIAKMPMMSANVTEFLIAKCAPGKVDAVKKACEKRQADLAANTLYPETVRLVEAYKLVTSGDYILFAVDEYAADMVAAFNSFAK